MWSNKAIESDDPDEFVTLVRPSGCKLLVTGRGQFKARGRLLEVGRLYTQQRFERLARVVHVDMPRSGILFLTEPGPSMVWNGAEIRYEQVVLFRSGETYISRLSGPTNWGAMSLADNDMEAIWPSHLGCHSTRSSRLAIITPPAGVLACLRSLHALALEFVQSPDALPKNVGFVQQLERALVVAMTENISVADVHSDTMARQHHQIIIHRFLELLDAQSVRPFQMQEVSDKIGVSSRTLRLACQQHLGGEPHAIPAALSHAAGTACIAGGGPRYHAGNRYCDGVRFLGTWAICCQIPPGLW